MTFVLFLSSFPFFPSLIIPNTAFTRTPIPVPITIPIPIFFLNSSHTPMEEKKPKDMERGVNTKKATMAPNSHINAET